MHIIEIVLLIVTFYESSLKRLTVAKTLHPLQILASDSWRVKFLTHDIIPDGLLETPKFLLQVNFTKEAAVDFGNILTAGETRSEPVFINTITDFGLHVLIMTGDHVLPKLFAFSNQTYDFDHSRPILFLLEYSDRVCCQIAGKLRLNGDIDRTGDLDYPSPTSHDKREYLHWMVFNINHVQVQDGEVLSGYVSPHRSGHEGGTHRYMFAYFRQQEGTSFDFLDFEISEEETDHPERTRFCTKTFVKDYNLSLPIAANFFRIDWSDDSNKIR